MLGKFTQKDTQAALSQCLLVYNKSQSSRNKLTPYPQWASPDPQIRMWNSPLCLL